MEIVRHDPESAPETLGRYTNALELRHAERLLFISGQIPQNRAGGVPEDFESQCRLVRSNVVASLNAAGMTVENLVKVTTFLSSREYAATNSAVRRDVLEGRRPALTVVVADIFSPEWLLEIEAIAAA